MFREEDAALIHVMLELNLVRANDSEPQLRCYSASVMSARIQQFRLPADVNKSVQHALLHIYFFLFCYLKKEMK